MKLTVRYMAQARDAVGFAQEELDVDGGISVHDLVVRLARQHGAAFRAMALDASGCPHPSLLVVIGDEQVRPGDRRTIREGESVTLLAPISGG